MPARYWLLKSEPDVFSFEDLCRAKGRRTSWDGVRNYQARNLLRDELAPGDGVLFYHSSTEPAGVAGLARVARGGYPDPTQFDARSPYHDPASTKDAPRWFAVEIEAVKPCRTFVTLAALRGERRLAGMALLRRGNRLSVQPVGPAEWKLVVELGGLS